MKEEKGSPEIGDLSRQSHACRDKPVDNTIIPLLT